MERQKKIQGQSTVGIDLRKYLVDFDRDLLYRNVYSSNKTIDNNYIIDRKYSDPEFAPIRESIGEDNEEISLNDFECTGNIARWVRPEQIRWPKESEEYELSVFNNPQSKDIIQGCLGNCWFVSALSLISQKAEILYKVMITKEYNPTGLYEIRLCKRGISEVITIDDMLPVTQSNSFVFTRCRKKQLFASLIEKALAKMYGNYKSLQFGRCVEGLQILTGKPCEIILLHSNDRKKKQNLNEIWIKLIQCRDKGYLMTCLSSSKRFNQYPFYQTDVELDHAYSILDLRQVGSERIIRLRNPWGKNQRNDTFNDNRRIAGRKSWENDGVFSMTWEEMCLLFSEITLCKISGNDHQIRRRGQFSDFSCKMSSSYCVDCPSGSELDIELFNGVDVRCNNDPEIDLFLIVMSCDGCCKGYKHSVDYYVTLSLRVESGEYLLLCGSMSTVHYSINVKYNLVIHSSESFVVNERPSSSCELIGNAFLAVGSRINNRKDFGDGVSILRFNDNGGFAFICENKSNRTIRLTTDFEGSINVLSSRKSFHLVDIIPSRTKQLFAMFTRKSISDEVHIAYQVKYESLNKFHGVDHISMKNNPPIPFQARGLHILKRIH